MRRISVSYWFVIRTSGLDWIELASKLSSRVGRYKIQNDTTWPILYLRDIFEKLAKESKHHKYKKKKRNEKKLVRKFWYFAHFMKTKSCITVIGFCVYK